MRYENNGRAYEVDSIEYDGQIINVNGISITVDGSHYTVQIDGDEVVLDTFLAAYLLASRK